MFVRIAIVIVPLVFVGSLSWSQETPAATGIEVAEMKLGKDVKDRQPVDETTSFSLNERVYVWMKVVGGKSDSLTVTWKTGDQVFETQLYVGGSPWRTWAYKTAYAVGDWTVSVSDAAGAVLKEMGFTVSEEMKQE